MSVIYILLGISLLVALIFLGGFFWSVRSGQYEDDYTPGMRILFDDSPSKSQSNNKQEDGSRKVPVRQ